MGKTLIAGALFIVAAIVTVVVGAILDLQIDTVFFGLAVGAVLAMVSDSTNAPGRIGAFLVGMVVTMVGYIIRILALNDSLLGQILFAALVAILITVICAATMGRLPLWGGFLGAALVTGAYEASFLAAPQDVQTNLFANVSMALVPMSIAFLAGIFIKPEIAGIGNKEDKEIRRIEDELAGSGKGQA